MLVSSNVATMFASRLLALAIGHGGSLVYRARFAYEAQRSRRFHMRSSPGCGWRRPAKLAKRAIGNANVLATQGDNIPMKHRSSAAKVRWYAQADAAIAAMPTAKGKRKALKEIMATPPAMSPRANGKTWDSSRYVKDRPVSRRKRDLSIAR